MEDSGLGKEYLENVLGYPIEKFEVKAGAGVGDGYNCALFAVDVRKVAEPENPISIVVKCYPVNESRQQFLDSGNIFKVELGMYDTVIPALNKFQEILPEKERVPLPFAPMIFGQYIKPEDRLKLGRPLKPLDNSIVMSDLRKPANGPFILRDRFLGFDLDHYKLVIENQATLHAISWAYKSKRGLDSLYEEFPFLDNEHDDSLKPFMAFIDANIKTNEELFRDRPDIVGGLGHLKKIYASAAGLYSDCDMGQNEKGHTKDSILKVPGEIVQDEAPWTTLLHGDCWSNNLMFRYDQITGRPVQVVFIDLQMSRESDPMNDICYAIFTSAQPDVRRKHLKSMLHVYYDLFTGICEKFGVEPLPGWSWKELNRRFHRAQVIGGYMALGLHIVLRNPDDIENLDDAMAKVDTNKEDGDTDTSQKMEEFYSRMVNPKKLHPVVLPRISAVLEELIEGGIL